MALVSTVSAEASQPNIPLSVIFMTSSAILMNEMHERTWAPFLGHTGHTSDAKVLVAELRPGHYILMVGTVHCTVPLLSLRFNQIEECLTFDEENFSVRMTSDIDGAGSFRLKFKSAAIFFLFRHCVSSPRRSYQKYEEMKAILELFGSCCIDRTPIPGASSPGLLLPPTVLGAAFAAGAAFGLVYVLFFQ